MPSVPFISDKWHMAIPGMFLVIQNVPFLALKHSYYSRTQHLFFKLCINFFFFGQIDDVRKFLSPKFKMWKFLLAKIPQTTVPEVLCPWSAGKLEGIRQSWRGIWCTRKGLCVCLLSHILGTLHTWRSDCTRLRSRVVKRMPPVKLAKMSSGLDIDPHRAQDSQLR